MGQTQPRPTPLRPQRLDPEHNGLWDVPGIAFVLTKPPQGEGYPVAQTSRAWGSGAWLPGFKSQLGCSLARYLSQSPLPCAINVGVTLLLTS